MAEYIEREALIDKTSDIFKNGNRYRVIFFDDVILAPAADVAPVVHGRWVNGCQCSVCGDRHGPYNSRHVQYYNYCPNCGAKMDEEG